MLLAGKVTPISLAMFIEESEVWSQSGRNALSGQNRGSKNFSGAPKCILASPRHQQLPPLHSLVRVHCFEHISLSRLLSVTSHSCPPPRPHGRAFLMELEVRGFPALFFEAICHTTGLHNRTLGATPGKRGGPPHGIQAQHHLHQCCLILTFLPIWPPHQIHLKIGFYFFRRG